MWTTPAFVEALNPRKSGSTPAPGGADWVYNAGVVAILLGAAIVFILFPRKDDEQRLLAAYHAEDTRHQQKSRSSA